jgi:hypothetical protein
MKMELMPGKTPMQNVQCDKCRKRYIIKGINSSKATLKYRCKVCSHIIVVVNPKNAEGSDKLQASEKQLMNKKTIYEDTRPPERYSPSKKNTIDLKLTTDTTAPPSLGLRSKFTLAICAVFLCATVLIYFLAGSRLQKDAEKQVSDKARFLLTTMEASRSFTSKVIKPALYQALPDRFIVEGMSSSFGARNIFERIRKTSPQYYFKHAARYPRNPINQADLFEMSIINKFKRNPKLKEWQGYRTKGEEKVYSIMKPIVAEEKCMRCHSEPELAPQELLDRYGYENGFNRSVGEVIGALTVSVPASVVFDKARNNTMLFIGMVVLFFMLLLLVVNILF